MNRDRLRRRPCVTTTAQKSLSFSSAGGSGGLGASLASSLSSVSDHGVPLPAVVSLPASL